MGKNVEQITTEMMEHVCDELCRHPRDMVDKEQLAGICEACEMQKYVCDLCNV